MLVRLYFACIFALFMLGCPVDDNPRHCEKVMHGEEDVEMLCDRADSGCGDSRHYFVHEHCYETCKDNES